jgi:hypothetical protein
VSVRVSEKPVAVTYRSASVLMMWRRHGASEWMLQHVRASPQGRHARVVATQKNASGLRLG